MRAAAAVLTSAEEIASSEGLGDALRAVACLCKVASRANAAPGLLFALLGYIIRQAPDEVLKRKPTLADDATVK